MKTPAFGLRVACLGLISGLVYDLASAQSVASMKIDRGIFYRSTLAAAEKALRLNETREARYWLRQAPASLRGWEWDYLNAQSDLSMHEVKLGDREASGFDIRSDATMAAVGFTDGQISLFSLPDWRKLRDFPGHTDAVYSVEFSHDGARLVTVSRDVTSRIWDVERGQELSHIKLDNPGVGAATFSPDGKQAATCTWLMTNETGTREVHGVVWIWNADSGDVVHKTRVGIKPLDSIAWSSDGQRLVVGSWDGCVHVLSKDAKELGRLQVPDEGVYTAVISVAISAGGEWTACGSKDRTARVWNTETGALVATLVGHDGFVTDVSFSPTGNQLWTSSTDGTLRGWDIKSAKPLAVLRGHEASVVELEAIPTGMADAAVVAKTSADSDHRVATPRLAGTDLYSVSLDGTIRRWSADAADAINLQRRLDHDGTYTTVWSPDGTRLYVACFDGSIQVIDSTTGLTLDSWTAHEGSSCNTLSLSSDGRRLLTCSWDKTARLWDPVDHSLLRELKLNAGCHDCSVSPNGQLAALTVGETLEIWDIKTGQKIASLPGANGQRLTEVCFSPDGKRIAVAGGVGSAVIVDVATRQVVSRLGSEAEPAGTVCWSPSGDFVATSARGWVRLWSTESWDEVRRYRIGDRDASQLAFSPDGQRLFVGAEAITGIDPRREGTLLRFQPCDDDIYYLSVGPNGQRLASCTTGGLITIVSSKPRPGHSRQAPSAASNDIHRSDWSIKSGRIVFSAMRGGQRNLFVYDHANQKTAPLTNVESQGRGANNPRPSPDGKYIAYQALQPDNYDLGLITISSHVTSVFVENPAYEVSPVWSPDSQRIAFMSTRGFTLGKIGPFPGHIYSQELNGNELKQVTREPLTSSLGPSDWSPDGKSLLMARPDGARIRIISLDVATGQERPITDSSNKDYAATYSNDGQRIAFHSETDHGSQIVVSDLDGGNRTEITHEGYNYEPRWSPDNEWLLFTRSMDGKQYDICAVNIANRQILSLVATEEDEREGNWLK